MYSNTKSNHQESQRSCNFSWPVDFFNGNSTGLINLILKISAPGLEDDI